MSGLSSDSIQYEQVVTSPLLEPRTDDSSTIADNARTAGINAALERSCRNEGTSAAISVRPGSEQSSPAMESGSYSVIPDPPFSRFIPGSAHATHLKSTYQNDSAPRCLAAARRKKPRLRPPPRSQSESDVEASIRPPPRTYLNNRVCTPGSRNRNLCTNEINNSLGTVSTTPRRRQRICFIMAFVAIFIAISLAAVAAFFSIHTYLITRHSKQAQESEVQNEFAGFTQNQSLASAHVGLVVKNPTAEERVSNYTLHLTDKTSRLHHHKVQIWDRGLTIQIKGLYFVYSSIGFNMNEHALNCDRLKHKTWVHQVFLNRGKEETALLRSEHTCCSGCPEFHTSGFSGGVFELQPHDNIYVRVSTPLLVFGNDESSFLGLYLLK